MFFIRSGKIVQAYAFQYLYFKKWKTQALKACSPSLMKASWNVCTAINRSNIMCSRTLCLHLHGRDAEHVCIRLHCTECIRLKEAQVWVCSCNQASFSSADSSFTLSVWSQLLHQQPIYYCCLATGSSLHSFGPLSKITTKTLSLQNQGGCDSPDTTSSLFSSLVKTVFLTGPNSFCNCAGGVEIFYLTVPATMKPPYKLL